MRSQLLALAAVSFLFGTGGECCGVGEPELAPRYGGDLYSSAIAVGSEADVTVLSYGIGDPFAISQARLDDWSLAQIDVVNADVLVRPHSTGGTTLTVKLADDSVLSAPLTFAPLAVVRVTSNVPQLVYPMGRPQVFAGSTFTAYADYRDANDNPMLGHGLESWSSTGATLDEAPGDDVEAARTRYVTAGDAPLIAVTARATDPAFEVEVVPAGSTAGLDLDGYYLHLRNTGEITLRAADRFALTVSPFSADGRYIGGYVGAGMTATIADPLVASASVAWGQQRATIDVVGNTVGDSTLTVTFDGITRTFAVHVY